MGVFIPDLGEGIVLAYYSDDYGDAQFEALYEEEDVLDLASDKDNEGVRIKRLLHVTREGLIAELTIDFIEGKLVLARKPKPKKRRKPKTQSKEENK